MPETKKTKKTVAKKKVEPFPPNPTRAYGAGGRKMETDEKTAARLGKDCGFRLVSKNGDRFVLNADAEANAVYEGQK